MNQPLSLPFSFTFFSLFLIMACSKLFSGDLTEITNYTIQYLRNDLKSLYSCIFVNRHLCQITIPILWEDPFSVKCQEGSHNLLDTCSLFFNEDDETKLKEFGITINSPSFQKPLFNYPSFIKRLYSYKMELHIAYWINNLYVLPKSTCSTNQVKSDRITFLPKYSEIFISLRNSLLDSKKLIRFICLSLFKLFINNDASLNELDLSDRYVCKNLHELIFNNPKFISNIKTLIFDFDFHQHFSTLL